MNRFKPALAAMLTGLLVAAGLTVTTSPAAAAESEVSGATLEWGIKGSFTDYLSSPIAAGGWTVSGSVTEATPFSWSGGYGVADQGGAAGAVDYGSSIHFTGHDGALDVTFSDFRVVVDSGSTAAIVIDAVYNSMEAPAEFTTVTGITFATVDLAAAVDLSDASTIAFADAPATLTADGAATFGGFYDEGTALDAVSFAWPIATVPEGPQEPPAPSTPAVTVSKTDGLHPGGEVVTVTGTGFVPNPPDTDGTRPPLAGTFSGAYVVFGKFADTWRPSEGAPSSARKIIEQRWAVDPSNVDALGAQAVAIGADGSFSTTLTVSKAMDAEPGEYGIFTFAGSGAVYAPFETFTPISFSAEPSVLVSKVGDLDPSGETITVKGWNFGPNAPATNGTRPPLAGRFGGAYVVFGRFADTWKPSEGAPSSARTIGAQRWVVEPADVATLGAQAVAIDPDGTFELTLDVSAMPDKPGNYGVYTYPGSGAAYAPFETYTPVSFTAAAATSVTLRANPSSGLVVGDAVTLTATVAPAQAAGTVRFAEGASELGTVPVSAGTASLAIPGVVAGSHRVTATFVPATPELWAGSSAELTYDVATPQVAAGSLTWGVKESFRDYVTGNIAQGSITVSGAGTSGGAFVFGQASGGTFDPTSGVGSSPYTGSVQFYGHHGAMDVTIANPVVQIESASTATLIVSANGSQVAVASLNLAAGTRTSGGNTVGWRGVPATLTAAGAGVFSLDGSPFYPAGTPMDPVTFVIGSPGVGGGTATVAAFQGLREPAPTPPATTGVTVDAEALAKLRAGGEITITAEGFAPFEEDILIVIYSDPVLLDRVSANGDGVVTWTGRLPAGLTGSHTLTVQGSVARGIVLDIPANIRTAAQACSVDDAVITWGFKETFRSYISGTIANGEWTVADGATYQTPEFGWADGQGAYDPERAEGLIAFGGSIRFTGHGGVLDTTVANPQLRFVDEDTAVLLMDVSGTTQDGTPVDQKAVEFVELDLTGGVVTVADGEVTVDAAPTVLLPAGANAFGTYEAGEAFDPLTATFTLPQDCLRPQVDHGADQAEGDQAASGGPDLGWLVWVVLGALVVGAVVALLVVRRRNA